MPNISEYKIIKQIYSGNRSVVFRGRRMQDNLPVIIKTNATEFPSETEIARLRREYELGKEFSDEKHIIRYLEFVPYQNTMSIIQEDFGGINLSEIIPKHGMELSFFLKIAIQLADGLNTIHQKNIIHKDISPYNIVIHPEKEIVKLIDFGMASHFSHETHQKILPEKGEGTLNYISPEQTGRINRVPDYRTDLYALGVVFYQLLSGKVPFQTDDPLELIHAHIAKIPVLLHEIRPDIPKVLSEMVMKLLEKEPEKRYQSATGLKADLQKCLNQWKRNNVIFYFEPGLQDIPDKLQFPQKLYGREDEIRTLKNLFERICDSGMKQVPKRIKSDESYWDIELFSADYSHVFVLISGYAGIGKSVLANELRQSVAMKHGYFLSGKFDQQQKDSQHIAYSAIIQAFHGLIRQILGEPEARIRIWREHLINALYPNARLITDMIPEIELIIGKQPDVKPLDGTEARNLFNMVFRNFVAVFAQKAHPLVLFLDDLQWADIASLNLIQFLMESNQFDSFMLIGAYRHNEVHVDHPVIKIIEEIKKSKASIHYLFLSPLNLKNMNYWIADTLTCDLEKAEPLAQLVYKKTGGNPFFAKMFVQAMVDEELIVLSKTRENSAEWKWDMKRLIQVQAYDNVAQFMAQRISHLPPYTREILKIAASLGNRFTLNTLSVASQKKEKQIVSEIRFALNTGMIIALSDQNYEFAHDWIQEAAYSLISGKEKPFFHLTIGRRLLSGLSAEKQKEILFELVEHLNIGKALIASDKERIELIRLNLKAAQKAKASVAYNSAQRYLAQGAALLNNDIWDINYGLAFEFYKEQAWIEYLNGNFKFSESLIYEILNHVKSDVEKAEAYVMLIEQYTVTANYRHAIRIGKKGLHLLGIDLPEDNLEAAFSQEFALAEKNLGNRSVASLIREPMLKSPEKRAAIRLLEKMGSLTYNSNQALFPIVIAKSVNLALEYGNAPEVSYGFAVYGVILGSVFKDYKRGYEFGMLGVNLSEKFNSLSHQCTSYAALGCGLIPWVKHVRHTQKAYDKSYEAGLQSGELQFAGISLLYKLSDLFFQGKPLPKLSEDISEGLQFSQSTKNQWVTDLILAQQFVISNLLGLTREKFAFHNEHIEEAEYLKTSKEHGSFNGICRFHIFKAMILYLYEKPEKAFECIKKAEPLLSYVLGTLVAADYNFYHSLILTAIYPDASETEQEEYRNILETNQKQMKLWADNSPDNFLHQYLLVKAEIARITGNYWEATQGYDQSVESAQKNEFIHHAALANELNARFWIRQNKPDIATIYIKKAYSGYIQWGAKRKVADLDEKYPNLLRSTQVRESGSGDIEHLDLATVIKASQAISGEIRLDKLLVKIMKIIIENAGAQKGFLILKSDNQLHIEASANIDSDVAQVLQSVPVEGCKELSETIVRYVSRTGEEIMLHDAASDGLFVRDPYVIQNQPKSLLAMPIRYEDKIIGVLYLENNLATGIFTKKRLEILHVLLVQAAISLENAHLYDARKRAEQALQKAHDDLEKKVAERTRELAKTNEELKQEIKERHHAENELRKAKQLLEKTFASLDHVVFVVNPDTRNIIACNPAIKQIFGYEEDEVVGRNSEFLHVSHDTYLQFGEIFFSALDRSGVFQTEFQMKRKDGTIFFSDITITEIADESGKRTGMVSVVRDIEERIQAEKALQEAHDKLEIRVQERTTELRRSNEQLIQEIQERERAEAELRESEERFRQLAENIEEVFWVGSPDWNKIYYISPTYEKIWGRSCESLYSQPWSWFDSVIADDQQKVMAYIRKKVTGDLSEIVFPEYRIIRPDGDIRWILSRGFQVLNEEGKPYRIVGIAEDITLRKESEEELRKVKNYLDNIINSMPSVLVGIDAQERVTHWNLEAEKRTGISANQAWNQPLNRVFPQLAIQMEKVRQTIQDKIPQKAEKVVHQEDGERHYADIMVYPLIADGVEGAVLRIDDITSRVRLEEMMIQTEKMMSVGGLAAGMAHEINNPLGGIMQSIQNILRRISSDLPVNEKIALECGTDLSSIRAYMEKRNIIGFLEGIRESGDRAAKIVDNMLQFSRRSESRMERINLAELLDRTVELASHDYDLKKNYDFRHIEVIREYEADMPDVPCVATEIEQVILNLLRNAAQAMGNLKFEIGNSESGVRKSEVSIAKSQQLTAKSQQLTANTQKPTPKSCIILRLKKEWNMARIEVEDNGPGMNETTRRRIFEPFFTTKDVGIGTGLGLSVSYFIITNNHQGTMTVESVPGKGTTFIICLPFSVRNEKNVRSEK